MAQVFARFYDAGVHECVSIISPVTRSTKRNNNNNIKKQNKGMPFLMWKRKTMISPNNNSKIKENNFFFLTSGKVVYSDDISKASSWTAVANDMKIINNFSLSTSLSRCTLCFFSTSSLWKEGKSSSSSSLSWAIYSQKRIDLSPHLLTVHTRLGSTRLLLPPLHVVCRHSL